MQRTIWCEWAVVGGQVCAGVSLGLADGRFTSVATGSDPGPGVERRPGLSMAGLANVHSHAFHRALRHRTHGDGGTFWTWRERMYAVAAQLTPESAYRLARATFAEMVCAGITCVGEFHYVHHDPHGRPYADPNAMANAILAASTDAGLRITLLDTLYLHGGLDTGGYRPADGVQQRFVDGSVDDWIERVGQLSLWPTQRLGAAAHSVRAVDPASIARLAGWAAAAGVPLHAHVSEQPAENEASLAVHGCTPVQLLAATGALGPAFTAVHATHLTADDVAALGSAGATICLCPTTEADLADGIGPAATLHRAGATLTVGTDSQAVIDLLAESRAVEWGQRAVSGRRGVFSPTQLLHTATAAGHHALGWDDAGELRVGARADLVTVSLTSRRTAGGTADPLATAFLAATADDVTTVTVDGRDVVTGGAHRRIDVPAELDAALRSMSEERRG